MTLAIEFRRMGLALTLGVAFAAAIITWVSVVNALRNPPPIRSSKQPDAFVWGDRVFGTRVDFSAWLRAHGASYRRWERTHPQGASLLQPQRA